MVGRAAVRPRGASRLRDQASSRVRSAYDIRGPHPWAVAAAYLENAKHALGLGEASVPPIAEARHDCGRQGPVRILHSRGAARRARRLRGLSYTMFMTEVA